MEILPSNCAVSSVQCNAGALWEKILRPLSQNLATASSAPSLATDQSLLNVFFCLFSHCAFRLSVVFRGGVVLIPTKS